MVGEEVKWRRLALGYTREQFAAETGLTMVTIWRVETGRVTPSLDTLAAIAEVLDVPLDTLVGAA